MNFFFDFIIFGFLISDGYLMYWLWKEQKRFSSVTTTAIITVAAMSWGVIFYGSFLEPRRIVVREQAVQIGDSGQELRAAVLSDLHVGPYKGIGFVEKLVHTTLAHNPEVVFLAGDYIYSKPEHAEKLSPLAKLAEQIPVYAVMGNHDFDLAGSKQEADHELAAAVRSSLQKAGIRLLENSGTHLADDGIYLAGTQEIWTHLAEPERAISLRESAHLPTILLSHNPDLILTLDKKLGVDLMLSGHTHGGQIRLPFIGPVGKIPNELGQKFDRGLFQTDETVLFITSGVGESGPRARLFNPPEIVMMTIAY